MLTMRPINENGKWGSKQKKEYIIDNDGNKIYDPIKRQYKCRSIPSTDWNNRANADIWRKAWEDMANEELKLRRFDIRIDRRSYAEQGIEQIPTVHLGPAASQMEQRGIRTERGDINRNIEITNKEIRQLRARINHLQKWLADEAVNTKPPTLHSIISEILNRQGQSGISRLKAASQVLIFLQENNITDMMELEKKVAAMQGNVNSIRTNLKKVERRIDTLGEHLRHSENFRKYRKLKMNYEELYSEYDAAKKSGGFFAESKVQKALNATNDYRELHRPQLAMFDNAEKYLREVLQERFDPKKLPPIAKWREELSAKTAEKDSLYRKYYTLKDEAHKLEKIRASVREIMQIEVPKRTSQKSWDVER